MIEKMIYYSTNFLVELAAFLLTEPVMIVITLCIFFVVVGYFCRMLVIK